MACTANNLLPRAAWHAAPSPHGPRETPASEQPGAWDAANLAQSVKHLRPLIGVRWKTSDRLPDGLGFGRAAMRLVERTRRVLSLTAQPTSAQYTTPRRQLPGSFCMESGADLFAWFLP